MKNLKHIKLYEQFLNETVSIGTPEDIIKGKIQGGVLKSTDFKENTLVAAAMFYKTQEELRAASGKVTKIENNKITYQKSDGKLYANEPADLIIINGNFTK